MLPTINSNILTWIFLSVTVSLPVNYAAASSTFYWHGMPMPDDEQDAEKLSVVFENER